MQDKTFTTCKSQTCVEGCFCVEGFVMNLEGDCIPLTDCPGEAKHFFFNQDPVKRE